MLRRALFSTVLAAGAIVLAGCGGKENTVNTPDKATGTTPAKPDTSTTPPPIPPPPKK